MPRTRMQLESTPQLRHQIKVLNQRLWRLENTYTEGGTPYKKLSAAYRTMEQYATQEPHSKNAAVSHNIYNVKNDNSEIRLKPTKDEWNTMSDGVRKNPSAEYSNMDQHATREPQLRNDANSHSIYKVNNDNGAIRLKSTKAEWNAMSEDERKKLVEIVNNLWNNPNTSMTITSIKESYRASYESFIANRPELSTKNFSIEQYADMWRTVDRLRQNAATHIGSDEVNLMTSMYDVGYLMRTNQFEQAMEYMARGEGRNINRKARRRR